MDQMSPGHSFLNWKVHVDDFPFLFPDPYNREQITFSEWRWRETMWSIKTLPEISYEEIGDIE